MPQGCWHASGAYIFAQGQVSACGGHVLLCKRMWDNRPPRLRQLKTPGLQEEFSGCRFGAAVATAEASPAAAAAAVIVHQLTLFVMLYSLVKSSIAATRRTPPSRPAPSPAVLQLTGAGCYRRCTRTWRMRASAWGSTMRPLCSPTLWAPNPMFACR